MLKSTTSQSQSTSVFFKIIALVLSVSLIISLNPYQAWGIDEEQRSEQEALSSADAIDAADQEEEGSEQSPEIEAVQAESTNGSAVIVGDVDAAFEEVLGDNVQQLPSSTDDLVDLFYIDCEKVSLGQEQNIVIGFKRVIDAGTFTLHYESIATGKIYNTTCSNIVTEGDVATVLFKLTFLDETTVGAYRINSVSWQGAESGEYATPVSDNGISFVVDPSRYSDSTSETNIYTLDADDALNESVDISDALGVADETAAQSSSVYAARASKPTRLVIGLDPGHGGSEPGASYNGGLEKDLNLRIALACRDHLQSQGVSVVMTRSGDDDVAVRDRPVVAKKLGADVFVSFHLNTGGGSGSEVWVQNANWKPGLHEEAVGLAKEVLDRLTALGLTNRGIKERTCVEDTYEDGSLQDWYGVLKVSKDLNMPAILIEHAFLDNSADLNFILSHITEMGVADAEAIIDYYGFDGEIVRDDKGTRFQFANGSFLTNSWKRADGSVYYFGADGYAIKGVTYIWTDSYNYHFFDRNTGAMVTDDWAEGYYYGSDGKRMTSGWLTSGDKTYYLLSDGSPIKGPSYIWTNGYSHYYFDLVDGSMVTDAIVDGYYYGPDGKRASSGWLTMNGKTYYLLADGSFIKGPSYIWTNGYNHYYFDRNTGAMVTNDWAEGYFYGPDGKRVTSGWLTSGGKTYYLLADGSFIKGPSYIWTNGYNYYYFDRNTGEMVTNATAEGHYYGPDGKRVNPGWFISAGKHFYILNDGSLVKGASYIWTDKFDYYYFDLNDGHMITNSTAEGHYYGPDGKRFNHGWNNRAGSVYYVLDNGVLVKGKSYIWTNKYDFYFFDTQSGAMVTNKWIDGNYYGSDGRMATNQWLGTIWVDENGEVVVEKSTPIMGATTVSAQQLANTYRNAISTNGVIYPYGNNPDAPTIERFCEILIAQANSEGVRAEVVFAQMMLETGWLGFPGVCDPGQFNFAGIGATGGDNPGNSFSSIAEGILAQVQHLKAYASTEPLNNTCVDPRFQYVERGIAPIVAWLGAKENPNGTGWATGAGYGDKIIRVMNQIR